MDREREHALLLLMEGQQVRQGVNRTSQEYMPAGSSDSFHTPQTCRFEPGRRHLPAEFGGRIAAKRENRASPGTFQVAYAGASATAAAFEPLSFDHSTLTYTGTIFWDFGSQAKSTVL